MKKTKQNPKQNRNKKVKTKKTKQSKAIVHIHVIKLVNRWRHCIKRNPIRSGRETSKGGPLLTITSCRVVYDAACRHFPPFLLFIIIIFCLFSSLPCVRLSGHTPQSAPAPGARLLTQFVDKQRGGIRILPSSQHPLNQVSQRPVAYTQCWPSAQGVAVRPAKHIKSTFFFIRVVHPNHVLSHKSRQLTPCWTSEMKRSHTRCFFKKTIPRSIGYIFLY